MPILKNQRGFTLIEISIVLMIIGIIFSSGLHTFSIYHNYQSYKQTTKKLENIKRSITLYFSIKNSLPCPASMEANDKGHYQLRSADCDVIASHVSKITNQDKIQGLNIESSDDEVIIVSGYVPIHTLGLPLTDAKDSWGRHIKYSVSLNLTSYSTYSQFEGGIKLIDEAENSMNWDFGMAQYYLLSHGERGCEETLKDYKNCIDHATLNVLPLSFAEDHYYDDLVIFENYIDVETESPARECSVYAFLSDKGINLELMEPYTGRKIVPADGKLQICNKSILRLMQKPSKNCFTLTCRNGSLSDDHIVIN